MTGDHRRSCDQFRSPRPIREPAGRHGTILLVGVGLNRMTALHLAEQRSGRRLVRRWARDEEGEIRMVEEPDHASEG